MGPKKKGPVKDSRAEAKRRQLEELRNEQKSKVAELGLEFKNEEAPPDEIDKSLVEKPLLDTFLALIPYTNAWYASRAAEEEDDDLKKLQIDHAFNKNLVTMTKVGRHEDAMEILMKDTNHDLHYFNKLKSKAIEEGKFKVDFDLGTRPLPRPVNKLQMAADAPLPMFAGHQADSSSTSFKLAVSLESSANDACMWRF
jgi:hypothetical protein